MYSYIIGKVEEVDINYIVINNNDIGYLVYVANPYSFKIGELYKVYIYEYNREDEHTLYGFKEKEEKDLFLKLISVKGLGCKMALPMFGTGGVSGIIDAIERENILYLKKFPKIGDKVARQIILDLKGSLAKSDEINNSNDELIETLKALGYKQNDINKLLPKIDNSLSLEDQVKEALKLLLR